MNTKGANQTSEALLAVWYDTSSKTTLYNDKYSHAVEILREHTCYNVL
jgi:hypothetical protein